MSGWYKDNGKSDKIIPLIGDKYLTTSLQGSKGDISISGLVDKRKVLLGEKNTLLVGNANKNITLLGSVGVSLQGSKKISTLLGESATKINLIGVFPYSYFKIRIDTTYITIDFTDTRIDRD